MNIWSPDIFNKAWYFATLAHDKQTYGGQLKDSHIAYINHVGSVAVEVIWALQTSKESYNADLAIQCALLHDVIEDTQHTYEDIDSQFGKEVADGVLALTKDELISKDNQLIDSIDRIKLQPSEIWIVKMADRITNLYHPPFYWDGEKINAYKEEALVIYNELHTANKCVANRLLNKIKEYKSFLK